MELKVLAPVRMERAKPIPEKGSVLAYLRRGEHRWCSSFMYKDRETGKNAVEAYWLDDGVYTWSSETIYHFEQYDYPLPEEFVRYVMGIMTGR